MPLDIVILYRDSQCDHFSHNTFIFIIYTCECTYKEIFKSYFANNFKIEKKEEIIFNN